MGFYMNQLVCYVWVMVGAVLLSVALLSVTPGPW